MTELIVIAFVLVFCSLGLALTLARASANRERAWKLAMERIGETWDH